MAVHQPDSFISQLLSESGHGGRIIYGPPLNHWSGGGFPLPCLSNYLLKMHMQKCGEKEMKITWSYLFMGGYVTICHPTKSLENSSKHGI